MEWRNVFLDTEFTQLGVNFDLISLALVSEDGRELYVEVEGFDESSCSEFVREEVLRLCTGPKLSRDQAAIQVWKFLRSLQGPVSIWTDAPTYDGQLLAELLAPVRAKVPRLRLCAPNFGGLSQTQFDLAYKDAYAVKGLRRHHALDDAKALREAWLAIKRAKPRENLEATTRAPLPKRNK